jgi:glycosyltransferase involved in cell wall biosynthesis
VVLETIRALAPQVQAPDSLVVFHTPALSAPAREVLEALDGVRLVDTTKLPGKGATRNVSRASLRASERSDSVVDVLYRPCQVNSLDELRWLHRQGRRVLVNQLDVIAWSNPSYFSSDRLWLDYRELTRLVLAGADGIAFISDVARREVAAEGMLPAATPTHVVYCGTSSIFERADSPRRRPAAMAEDERPYLFVIGASYHHKNRVFACHLLAALRRRGWDGRLVLAGPTPPYGNSLDDEQATLDAAGLDGLVDVLADVTEDEKNWLYAHAALTVYPTTTEGFGLVPFESARWDVPVLSSRQGSLDEVLPADLPTLAGYDVDAATDLAWRLLHDSDARAAATAALTGRAADFTWERTAAGVLALAEEALRRPANRLVAQWGESGAHGWPEGWTGSDPNVFERVLSRMLHAERIKRVVVPEGSSRQVYVRKIVNWIRQRSR